MKKTSRQNLNAIIRILFVCIALCTPSVLGCSDESGDEACEAVCEKSLECGSTMTMGDCMNSCKGSAMSDECLECYEEETCSGVGRCLMPKNC